MNFDTTSEPLFAEAGYMKFATGTTHKLPDVDYGNLKLTNLSLGMRLYF